MADDDTLAVEFDELFAADVSRDGAVTRGMIDPSAIFKQQEVSSAARVQLGSLAGWLDGLIEQLQYGQRLQAEAQAYAEERQG